MSSLSTDAEQTRILALAQAIFGDENKTARWLAKPKRRFFGLSPMGMLKTPQGLEAVVY